MDRQTVIICEDFVKDLQRVLDTLKADKVYVLVDEHTRTHCLPRLDAIGLSYTQLSVGASDAHKNLESLARIWQVLSETTATRHSVLINLGGGMITDLGGFAAATFKRGIACINIPTTLLAMVDAAVGGKTGINFNGLKNEIGAFSPARAVLLDSGFLQTLDRENLLSGYAEMVKHGLISDGAHWAELLDFDLLQPDYEKLQALIARSVSVKEDVVAQDPFEKGIRKALNLGHTIGHAFESLALKQERPVLHGYAVAWGLIGELYLATLKTGFPKEKLRQTVQFVKMHYGGFALSCKNYDMLYERMLHDKKNQYAGEVNFTLLSDIGKVVINQNASKDEILQALDFFREAIG